MVKTVTGPQGQQRRSQDQEVAAKHRSEIVDYVMAHPHGREFVWSLLGECGVFRSSWHPSELIHFNEGRRDVGLKIMTELTADHSDAWLVMQKESIDRAHEKQLRENIYINEDNDDE